MQIKLLSTILFFLFVCSISNSVIGQVEQIKNDSLLKADSLAVDTIISAKKKSDSMIDAPIYYPAKDSTILNVAENKIYMYNQAKITYNDIELTAYYIELDLTNKEVFARGKEDGDSIIQKPVYKDGEDVYTTRTIRYNFSTEQAIIEDLMTPQSEGILHSELTKKDSLGSFFLQRGKFTTCDADHPHFYINLTKAKLTADRKVISGPAYLVIAGIPFYFIGIPFGFFPKQEKHSSGLLFPTFGEEINRGFFMRNLGWYFAINDGLDLSIVGDIYSKGSWRTHLASNYSKRYKFRGNVQLTFAKNVLGEQGLPNSPNPSNDFKVMWSHTQDPKAHPYRTFSAQVNFSSSKFDKQNSYQTQDHLRTTKSSSVSYRRKWDNPLFNFNAKLGHTQNSVDTTVNLSLPNLGFTIGRIFPFRKKSRSGKMKWYEQIDVRYSSKMENRIHAKESELFSGEIADNMRNGFQHDIPVSANFKLFKSITFTPSVKYQGNIYFNYIEKSWLSPEDSLSEGELFTERKNGLKYLHSISPSLSLSWNKKIYGFFRNKNNEGKVEAIRHVMTPSVGVSYRPNMSNDDLWYYNSVQINNAGDMEEYSILGENPLYRPSTAQMGGGNISFGFLNNVEMKLRNPADTVNDTRKVKLLESLNFSTNYDLLKDSMNLSLIRMNGRTKLFDNINLNFGTMFDPYVINENGQRMNKFVLVENHKLWRVTSANISCGFSFPFKKSGGGRNQGTAARTPASTPQTGTAQTPFDPYASYTYYDVSWQVNIDYSFRYTKPAHTEKITQSLRFNGFLKLTQKWNINFSSGYDFVAKDFTYTSATITRDLHCWEMSFNWIPFGTLKSYNFRLNVKSQLFKDLKIKKQKSWWDYQ